MANIKVEMDDKQANRLFNIVIHKTSNLRPVFRSIGEIVYNSVRENFRKESSPEGKMWAKLAKGTIEAREKRHPGRPIHILHDTGNLETSLHVKATNKDVRIGTNVNYANAMQFGNAMKHIPARPFLGINDSDLDNIKQTITDYFRAINV